MMRNPILLLLFLLTSTPFIHAQLQSPDEFLPHQIGETFTPHHLLVDYYEYVADNSPYVQLMEYGRTNEQRPLLLAFVSTPENLERLEAIRSNHLKMTGLIDGEPTDDDLAIVWLSFSVHGNEASGSESAMPVLYELATSDNNRMKEYLENTIVILDPSVNPDGYARYTHWFRGVANRIPNPKLDSREHREPWPGGRVNHYLFDLNRDWAWATQVESRQRLRQYQQWMPHIHADIHEQGINSPYYFAPAAEPFHKYITDWQRDFQTTIGKNHARYFDDNGWLYFTKERFDLFYPSYGDTYPTFNGAIGMTYEQAGNSSSGRAAQMSNGDTLTLLDRVMHHKTTALSTVEIASQNAAALSKNFQNYFERAQSEPNGKYDSYLIKVTDSQKDKVEKLTQLLDRHGIQYGSVEGARRAVGYDYINDAEKSVSILARDLVIDARQPMGTLVQVLFDPESELVDSLTYDITAWALPYAFGLEAYAFEARIQPAQEFDINRKSDEFSERSAAQPYAYLHTWHSVADAAFLGQLLQQGIKVRLAETAFKLDGVTYQPGTLIMTRADNRKMGAAFFKTVTETADAMNQEVKAVQTGFVDSGADFGSGAYAFLETPKVAIVGGEGTSSYSFGQVWWYFEQELNYPLTVINMDELAYADLDDYNLLIMPEGRYRLTDSFTDDLNDWMSAGGRVIAIGYANRYLEGKGGFALSGSSNGGGDDNFTPPTEGYSEQSRKSISNQIPGAIFKAKVDNTHPLGFGFPDYYFTLKTSSSTYPYQEKAWNVVTIGTADFVKGFAGANAKKAQKQSIVAAVQRKGRGAITYLVDNPLYRGFWEQGKFLFSNAVFFAGQ